MEGTAALSETRASAGAGGDAAAGAGGGSGSLSNSMKRTMHGQRTMVREGVLVTVPFKTSDKPFVTKHEPSELYGKISTIVNPPNKDRMPTTRFYHSKTAVTVVSAGSTVKRKVPFHPEAARNRLKNEPKRGPKPFAVTLKQEYGLINQKREGDRFMTMARVTQAPAAVPMERRLGFTNQGIISDIQVALHKTVLDDGRQHAK